MKSHTSLASAAAFLAALVSLASRPAGAQAIPAGRGTLPRFGVLAGVNFARLDFDRDFADAGRLGTRTALVAGAFGTFRFSPHLGFQPEVLYSQKGAQGDVIDEELGNTVVTLKIDYLEVPLLLRGEFPGGSRIRPFLLAGPAFAFKMGCKVEGKNSGASISIDCDQLSEESNGEAGFKSFDVGAMVGGGLDFALGRETLSLGARYTHGLVSIAKGSSTNNRVISIVLGLGF